MGTSSIWWLIDMCLRIVWLSFYQESWDQSYRRSLLWLFVYVHLHWTNLLLFRENHVQSVMIIIPHLTLTTKLLSKQSVSFRENHVLPPSVLIKMNIFKMNYIKLTYVAQHIWNISNRSFLFKKLNVSNKHFNIYGGLFKYQSIFKLV